MSVKHWWIMAAFVFGVTGAAAQTTTVIPLDEKGAEALAKKSGCMKCHAISSKKDGPAFKETAAKYKGKPGAEDALYKHLTTNPKIKVDGKEEEHDAPKTKSDAEIRNLVRWVLSR